MKRQFVKSMQHIAALTLGVLLTLGSVAQAAENTALGDVNGDTNDLADSNMFTLNTFAAALQKRAFLTSDNSALTSGQILPAGTSVDFLIYLSNESSLDINDVGILDTLAGFTYVPNSLHVLNTTAACAAPCTPGEEATIYADALGGGVKTDVINDDEASFTVATVEVGNNTTAGNTQQNAAANFVLALVFTATLD